MIFKISKEELVRRKYIVPIQMTIPILLFSALVWIQESDYEKLFFIIKIIGSLFILIQGVNYYFTKKFIEFSKKHKLEVNSFGIIFTDSKGVVTIDWKDVNKIIIEEKKSKIKKIFLEINNGELIQLSVYENLDLLHLELKKYLNK